MRAYSDPCFDELLSNRRNQLRRPPPGVSLSDVRAAAAAFLCGSSGPSLASVENLCIPGPDGAHLRLRLYRPVVGNELPAVLFCHGGGFVFGDLDTHDAMCRELARHGECVVVAVEYRLAPEWKFPAAIQDCMAAAEHLAANPQSLGIRPDALAIAGDSAGAHIAIGTVLSLKDRPWSFQHAALLYPVVDPSCNSQSMKRLGEGLMLTREAMQWFWECYLPDSETSDARAAVLSADLREFPSTTIVTADCDPLLDEGVALIARLRAAEVSVRVHRFAGMIHGFAALTHITPKARQALEAMGLSLKEAFLQQTGSCK